MKRFGISIGLLALSAAALVACGSGGGTVAVSPIQVAAAMTPVNATPDNTAGLVGVTVTADSGVAALGTTVPTTITIGGSAAAQTARVATGASAAGGRWTYGSCIFSITQSTFSADHPLALGKTATIEPCTVSVDTAGLVVDTPPAQRTLTLNLAGRSGTAVVNVNVTPSGAVVVNGGTMANTGIVLRSGG